MYSKRNTVQRYEKMGETTKNKKYEQEQDKAGIGTPKRFIAFKGADMNVHYGLTGDNAYQDDLPCLMFPLDGLDVGKLAVIKLKMHDRWFDDIVDSNRRRQEAING